MSPLLILAAGLLTIAQLVLPRRIAYLPFLIGIFHVGNASVVSEFTTMRLVMLAGLFRAALGGYLVWSPRCKPDLLIGIFALFALLSSFAHGESLHNPYIERVGLVLNVAGSYLYARAYLTPEVLLGRFATHLAIVVLPLSLMLGFEQRTGRNYYFQLGARSQEAGTRNDRNRAKGPFGHAIIAGTAGATSFPFMLFLWRRRQRILAAAGAGASLVIVLASASSGPLAALMAAFALLAFWRWRRYLNKTKAFAGLILLILNFTMSRPIWFLIARIDLVGGSTGWHRSMLIDNAMTNLHEWWLAGTDYTRHWMHSGVSWNPNHTDITNYYLQFGVTGGLPLMLTFVGLIAVGLHFLEKKMVILRGRDEQSEFFLWCLWTSILAHCVSFISIAYFDQSYALFFGILGAIPALHAMRTPLEERYSRTQNAAA